MKHSPTHVFDKKNNGITFSHGVIDEGVKLTRSSKFKAEELQEGEDRFFEGMLAYPTLLISAICWFIIGLVFMGGSMHWNWMVYVSWFCTGVACLFVLTWILIYALPAFWSVLKMFWKWLILKLKSK